MFSKKKLVAGLLGKTGLRALLARLHRWNGLLCLNYHRLGDGQASPFDRQLWSARADEFDDQVHFLKRHCDVVSLDDLAAVRRHRGRHILITFDDGYRDCHAIALPILRAHDVRAVFFLCTGFLDQPRLASWDEIAWMVRVSTRPRIAGGGWLRDAVGFDEPDRESAVRTLVTRYKELPPTSVGRFLDFLADATGSGRFPAHQAAPLWMTWDMVRELRDAGMTIGGHTVNHPILAHLSRAAQHEEILGCARRLEAELGEPMTCFSYPVGSVGSFNDDTRTCLHDLGVRYAFSFCSGYVNAGRPEEWDPYDIPRLAVHWQGGAELFRSEALLPQIFVRRHLAEPQSCPLMPRTKNMAELDSAPR